MYHLHPSPPALSCSDTALDLLHDGAPTVLITRPLGAGSGYTEGAAGDASGVATLTHVRFCKQPTNQ